MAIPFFLQTEDDAQTTPESIYSELSDILMRIDILQRGNINNNNRISRLPREACTRGHTRRVRRITRVISDEAYQFSRQSIHNMSTEPNLLENNQYSNNDNLRRLPYTKSLYMQTGILLPALASVPDLKCGQWIKDITKLHKSQDFLDHSILADPEDCGDMKKDVEDCSPSIFSKLIPSNLSSSIWTALLCVVGWHLLKAR